jgi:DedD protein
MATQDLAAAALEEHRRGRRRLIGAITIALLMVAFLPMLFDAEPQTRELRAPLSIPARDTAAPLPDNLSSQPVAPLAAPRPANGSAPAKAAPQPPPVSADRSVPAAAAPPAAAPAPTPAEVTPLAGFAVQIGAFRDAGRIDELKARLVALQINHFLERRASAQGEVTRLRAGPFKTRAQADAAAARLASHGIQGDVVTLP